MLRRKQVYKITYPNGKIYVGVDLIGVPTYFGSPSWGTKERMAAELAEYRLDLTVRKEILWESETATDVEARAKETTLIRPGTPERVASRKLRCTSQGLPESAVFVMGGGKSAVGGRALVQETGGANVAQRSKCRLR